MPVYVHKTANRLRIRSSYILENPTVIERAIDELRCNRALIDIKHKRYAGSVAITFDEKQIDVNELLDQVRSRGWMRQIDGQGFIEKAMRSSSRNLMRGAAVMVLKRVVTAAL